MFSYTTALLASCALHQLARASDVHGANAEGTIMGPVAFLWPDDRTWDASQDNTAPCGSTAGVTNRTDFPLDQGSVALTIADDAWDIEFHIAFANDPTSESDFSTQAVTSSIASIHPGHQCYKLSPLPDAATAGANATLQLQYRSTYSDSADNQTFYACADVTFVQTATFSDQVPCFNVTAEDFGATPSSSSSSSTSSTASSDSTASSSSGLSSADKAGIALGSVLGGLSVVGLGVFLWMRRRRGAVAAARGEGLVGEKEVEEGSVRSG